jgi:CheY-like chemotaxis protein
MGYILMADDDVDDIFLFKSAFGFTNEITDIKSVRNGEEALHFLSQSDKLPSLIVLDLNMPVKGGLSTLKEIRKTDKLKSIPIVIFSTSNYERDIYLSYACGANSYIQKPMSFQELEEIARSIHEYWFKTVLLN